MRRFAAISVALATVAMLIGPAAASARDSSQDPSGALAGIISGLLPEATQDSCEAPLLEQPFAFTGDLLDYVLAPDGSFEGTDGDGWLLEGGAAVVAGNDPFPIRPDGDDDSILAMPNGGAATSAPMCVDLDYPHFRLAAHQIPLSNGKIRGRLKVETLYPGARNPRWRKVDVLRPETDGWVVSDFLDLEPERGGTGPGGRQVSLRFTAINGGGFEVDDVYVDPRFRN
ncbi:MAG: hypothetical protein U0R24_11980 [Solirubrobacterales bacterium]